MRLSLRRARLSSVDDSSPRQHLKVNVFSGELADNIERFQNYGHTSVPPKVSEAIVAALGGNLDQLIALAVEDKDCRPAGLIEGDSCLYHLEGHNFKLTKDGVGILSLKRLIIDAEQSVVINTPSFTVNASTVHLNASGELTSNTPKATFTGEVFAQEFDADGIKYTAHFHRVNGSPTTGPQS
nr:phage baseplate assembly protein V [Agarivorans sp. B2Z047]